MKTVATEEAYMYAWMMECANEYPSIDVFESIIGHAVSREWLNSVARVLNCPVKVNPPNWQHGRVIYAVLKRLANDGTLSKYSSDNAVLLDIGTAKGFSAVVMTHALSNAGIALPVITVDLIEPEARCVRNTIAEVSGLKTLYEVMNPFIPEGQTIKACGGGSMKVLGSDLVAGLKIPFAFIDGKHTHEAVRAESLAVKRSQSSGDAIVFDDCQLQQVASAVSMLSGYDVEYLKSGPRTYAIARRI